jgi:hypothetical protein
MAIILTPERNMYEFIKVHIKLEKEKIGEGKKSRTLTKPVWIQMPETATSEVIETVKKDSEFKLLYAQSIRNLEQERMMFMSFLNKNMTLIVGIICVIALAIIIYVAVGGVSKIINVMADAIKIAPTCNAQAMSNLAKNVSIF